MEIRSSDKINVRLTQEVKSLKEEKDRVEIGISQCYDQSKMKETQFEKINKVDKFIFQELIYTQT